MPGFPIPRVDASVVASGGEVGVAALIATSGEIVPTSVVREAMVAAGCECADEPVADEGIAELVELAG